MTGEAVGQVQHAVVESLLQPARAFGLEAFGGLVIPASFDQVHCGFDAALVFRGPDDQRTRFFGWERAEQG